jgi:hypothetical protein
MVEKVQGVKSVEIMATTSYSIVSAFEYEFLKQESVVQERLKDSTIYFILQRPLMFFDNLVPGDGELTFDIVDGVNPPLQCKLDTTNVGVPPGEDTELVLQYYRDNAVNQSPYREVAGFKLMTSQGDFIVWETPQKLLFEALANGLSLEINGDIAPYLKYHVHYIGQAFSQAVWKRLTGHEKVQKILTIEEPLSALTTRPALEVSILMLSIIGFDEAIMLPYYEGLLPDGVQPIVHYFDFGDDNESFERFYLPFVGLGAKELTNEAEALLINLFSPKYNDNKFKNYPNLKKGARSVGYSNAILTINRLPAHLVTDNHSQAPIFVE